MNLKVGPRPEPDPSLKIQSPKGLKLEKIWPDPPLLTTQKKADSLLIATLNIEERASRTIILRTCVVEGE